MTDDNQTIITDVKSNNLKNTLIDNKKSIIGTLIFILILLFGYFFYSDFKKEKKVQISEKYNFAVVSYEKDNPSISITEMKDIINSKDPTYSPLALYFLIDNELLINKNELNEYFDILINNVDLDDEIKKLIIYKKGLYNSDSASEDELLEIFKPFQYFNRIINWIVIIRMCCMTRSSVNFCIKNNQAFFSNCQLHLCRFANNGYINFRNDT